MTQERDLKRVERVEALAHRMDSAFRVPITRIRLGWDSILGLVPGIGDTLALAPAAYIIWTAHDMGLPMHRKSRMVWNVFLDWLLGLIPLVGDIFDVGFKANRKNAAILRRHFDEKQTTALAA